MYKARNFITIVQSIIVVIIMLLNGAVHWHQFFSLSSLLSPLACHQNTVISLQPVSAPMPSPVVIPTQTNAPTYFILSLLSFILCSFIGGVFMFCIAPALACSSMVSFNWVIRTIACM